MLDNVIVILHQPRSITNIGGVVRAMRNMGVSSLRLVQPVAFNPADITGIAHRCETIRDSIQSYDSLDAALADVVYVLGTTARTRNTPPIHDNIREIACMLCADAPQAPFALLFGAEDNGLDNAALDRCHALVRIPTDPSYPSLNLSHAVLLVLYELRMAITTTTSPHPLSTPLSPPSSVTSAARETFFQLVEQALHTLDFFTSPPQTTHIMRMIRQLTHRANPGEKELALLTAIARAVSKRQGK